MARERPRSELIMEHYPCAYCGAKPGERCTAGSGGDGRSRNSLRYATYSHSPRFYAAEEAGEFPIPDSELRRA